MLVDIFCMAMQSNVISTRSRKVRMHKLNELNFFPRDRVFVTSLRYRRLSLQSTAWREIGIRFRNHFLNYRSQLT